MCFSLSQKTNAAFEGNDTSGPILDEVAQGPLFKAREERKKKEEEMRTHKLLYVKTMSGRVRFSFLFKFLLFKTPFFGGWVGGGGDFYFL